MSDNNISIITRGKMKPLADSSEKPTGLRKGGPAKGSGFWDQDEELEPIRLEYLTKTEVPVSKLEAELETLVDQMRRILTRLEPNAREADQYPDGPLAERKFVLNEISIHVEISAEGALSILGTGGKLGGKGGMQLTFAKA